MASAVFGPATFCAVTGGSRGLGRSIAVLLAGRLGQGSRLVLTGRSLQGLQETKRQVEEKSPNQLEVKLVTGDLEDSAAHAAHFCDIFADAQQGTFKNALMIHNAATLGDGTKKASEHSDPQILTKYYAANLTSVITLTSKFMKIFPSTTVRRTVVNITSDSAINPLVNHSLYCSGKAARNMFFKVMAEEDPDVRVLSYSPGPLDTDMLHTVRSCGNKGVEDLLTSMESSGMILSPADSAEHLLNLLEKDTFQSGDFLDIFNFKY
ncbi:sepiapterin reductase-like isoform X1 [Branchiostoma floridae]|uniref:Sepiapterin reductase n=1 Tax=Branchiostoma floridae TaxID=7739 RepID=A0A9J7MLL4_BRAFL|nr:sepiapterin reductase-like isoform X1 [Branchiostoma floridae]